MKCSDKWLRRCIKNECSFVMRDNVRYVRESNILALLDEREAELREKLEKASYDTKYFAWELIEEILRE